MHVKELFDLSGKTAIVTGGGRGLGEQIAESLAEAGANVVVCSRKLEACKGVSDRLEKYGVQTLAIACDVTNPADVARVVDTTLERFGTIDILFNNSGVSWGTPTLEMPLDKWKMVLEVNVTGTFLMSQAVAKVMVENKSGKIINIASVAGFGGQDPQIMDAIGYSTSKGAVITFTKDLAVKLGPANVQVNAIAPGFFPTKMSSGLIAHTGDLILKQIPAGRFGSNDDLKGAALFLASRSSDFVLGHVLAVDGGMNAM